MKQETTVNEKQLNELEIIIGKATKE